jgi:hypothetical protein
VTLHYEVTFPNGKKFILEGTLMLEERQLPVSGQGDMDQRIEKL